MIKLVWNKYITAALPCLSPVVPPPCLPLPYAVPLPDTGARSGARWQAADPPCPPDRPCCLKRWHPEPAQAAKPHNADSSDRGQAGPALPFQQLAFPAVVVAALWAPAFSAFWYLSSWLHSFGLWAVPHAVVAASAVPPFPAEAAARAGGASGLVRRKIWSNSPGTATLRARAAPLPNGGCTGTSIWPIRRRNAFSMPMRPGAAPRKIGRASCRERV